MCRCNYKFNKKFKTFLVNKQLKDIAQGFADNNLFWIKINLKRGIIMENLEDYNGVTS